MKNVLSHRQPDNGGGKSGHDPFHEVVEALRLGLPNVYLRHDGRDPVRHN